MAQPPQVAKVIVTNIYGVLTFVPDTVLDNYQLHEFSKQHDDLGIAIASHYCDKTKAQRV